MKKTIIFDMDGIIIDSEPIHLQQIQAFLDSKGFVYDPAFLPSLIGCSSIKGLVMMQEHIEGFYEDLETYRKDSHAFFAKHPINYKEAMFPYLTETLTWLKEEGWVLACASNSSQKYIEDVLAECELESYFTYFVSGERFKEGKPHPEIYLHVADKLGVLPEECIVVEDSELGILAGTRAGMKVISRREERYNINQRLALEFFDDYLEFRELLPKMRSLTLV